ncbi:Uncharacterized protein Adt_42655 [Abeliophyllum distichum]|uniref:Uncharacterized protein n=1 Tax=Abeliophyllum distichum TaxID=126358 RepID=A0ABD1PS93_9LAMI
MVFILFLFVLLHYQFIRGGKRDEQIELNEFDNGRDELELRRSTRTRRAPVFLDSSPLPPKKRRKVDKGGGVNGAEKVEREDGVKCEAPCSSSRDLEGENNGWLSRLRARGVALVLEGGKGGSLLQGAKKGFLRISTGSKKGQKFSYMIRTSYLQVANQPLLNPRDQEELKPHLFWKTRIRGLSWEVVWRMIN